MDNDELTVDGARAAEARGELHEWVAGFLGSPGSDNAELARTLASEINEWTGPVSLPFDKLNRLAGPPDQPTLDRLDEDDLETVEGMQESIEEGWTPAPLVVTLRGEQLVVEDGNHRIEGLRRAGKTEYWAVVGFTDAAERDRFVKQTV